jgi:hypothetical protein
VKRPIMLMVTGKSGAKYSFVVHEDPEYLPEWNEEGLEMWEIAAIVPDWAVRMRLTRAWVATQSAWQWMRLW